MRFSQSTSVERKTQDHKVGNFRTKKKHKRLDAICDRAYAQSHSAIERKELVESSNAGGDELELRRSTRVRKAPVLLDSSPPPPKRRKKVDKRGGVNGVKREEDDDQFEMPCSTSRDLLEDTGGWRTRLRSRSTNARKGESSPACRRKLVENFSKFKSKSKMEAEPFDDSEERQVRGELTIVKSKRPGRVKASNAFETEHLDIDLGGSMEDDEDLVIMEEVTQQMDEEDDKLIIEEDVPEEMNQEKENSLNKEEVLDEVNEEEDLPQNDERDKGVENGNTPSPTIYKEEDKVEMCLQSKQCMSSDNVESMEQDMPIEKHVCGSGDQRNALEVDFVTVDENVKDDANGDEDKQAKIGYLEKAKDEVDCSIFYQRKGKSSREPPANERTIDVSHVTRKRKIKEGRHCGLCGGGTDGKPPRKLVQDGVLSDNEAHSESSTSEEPNYDVWDGFGDEPSWLGRLLGPINDRFGIAGIWVHQQCAVWSPEVYFAGLGCMKNVRAALSRGRVLKCSRCGKPGATIGCRVDRCPRTYHLPCARATGCIFDHRKFLIACTDHRHLFQPHGSKYLHRLRKMKAKKMKLELRKTSNDALRKDIEAEEKWLENCGEDEEFLKRESKRLHRDLLRISPVYIGGSNSDTEVQFQGWESIAGLQDVIQCMKEVVILPLLYPEFFSSLGLTPPRGVLLHGYPGTGKTLVVRALIGSCARGDKRIAYFARKGADCLGKYVGDAERQLRLLFQVAEKSQPSIIFFDEIDGLAPCRTRQQDQTHSSVVSTLLALMDGLKSRGSVVVIGATNRPDAVDPALRRPGRFDREIYFPLPSVKDREAILSLHTKKWPKPVSGPLLKWIAKKTVGFAGADLQALCTQAVIVALKRSFPLHQYLSAATKKGPDVKCSPLPIFTVEEQDWLEALTHAPPPCSRREAGMTVNDVVSAPLHTFLFPCLSQPLCKLLVSLYLDERLYLPDRLSKAASLVKDIFISALDKKKALTGNWWLYIQDLLKEPDVYCKVEDHLSRASILVRDSNIGTSAILEENIDDDHSTFGHSKFHHMGARASLVQNISGKKSGFRLLVSGNPRCGQRHLASCLLHCFVGNTDIQKIDLATISQEGHGDIIQGLTWILMRCASVGNCMIYMPRLDLWAVETNYQVCEAQGVSLSVKPQSFEEKSPKEISNGDNYPVANMTEVESRREVREVSYVWNSFVEQVETLGVSTSLTILATSEMPFQELPFRIRQYFKGQKLDQSLSTPLGDSMPQFSVQLDESFNVDLVVDLFAARLCNDLSQHFIQLIYHANHVHMVPQNGKDYDETMENIGSTCPDTKAGTAIEHEGKQCSINPITPVAPNNKHGKGKSNLLSAITTFGYQILRYPHFAELCWVTSKLKDGPSFDLNGHWKSWPFNSCILRPNNSVKEVSLSTSNMKSKENSGIVRGLIAIGLSAYTGKYAFLREVSSDVRKVLELLVAEINDKVQGGKDRYQFSRLLSQVAYLDDMFSSWLYMLQSLEVDTQRSGPEANSAVNCVRHLEESNPSKNTSLEGDETLHEARTVEGSAFELNAENDGRTGLEGEGDRDVSGTEVASQSMDMDPSTLVENVTSTIGLNTKNVEHSVVQVEGNSGDQDEVCVVAVAEDEASQLVDMERSPTVGHTSISLKNGVTLESSTATVSVSHEGEDCGSKIHSNGHAEQKSIDIQDEEDGPCGPDGRFGTEISVHRKVVFNLENGLPLAENNLPLEDDKRKPLDGVACCSNKATDLPKAASGLVCFFGCCTGCLEKLHHLLRKVLRYEWGLKGKECKLEDVYDFVASLSAKFHSSLRMWLVTENCSSFDKKGVAEFEHKDRVENSDKRLKMMECSCHSSVNREVDGCESSEDGDGDGDGRAYIFRDGVLTNLEKCKEVCFHCEIKKLCLHSLIEWIEVGKEP
nr:ATPase family aaa domain-containing protein [Ipomoea batatas]